MLRSYFILFARTFKRQPMFTFINLCGLCVSIVCTLLIYLYVDHELHYDGFHHNANRLYRVNQTFIWAEDDKSQFSRTGPGVAVALREELPDVELVTSLHTPRSRIISYTNPRGEVISFEERDEDILAADTNFFKVFNFPLIAGDAHSAFRLANTLMMTESTAKKYFGDENPIGKMVVLKGTEGPPETFEVTGILEDVPGNSTIRFNVLLSMKNFPLERLHWSWVWTQLETFVLLRENADINAVNEKLADIPRLRADETLRRVMGVSFDEYVKSGKSWDLFLQPINTLHLPEEPVVGSFPDVGSKTVIYALIGAAIFIVLLSCINFMNLSTAKFTRRIREASIRKVLGLGRQQLAFHYMSEAFVFCFLSAMLAFAITQLLLPSFNSITQKTLAINGDVLANVVLGLTGLVLIMTLISSIYPAIFLTKFNPADSLKGRKLSGKEGKSFRNSLVVAQFTISMVLAAVTGVVFQQLSFMHQKDLGFIKENLVTVRHLESVENDEQILASMLNVPGVVQASACSAVPPSIFGGDVFTTEAFDGTFSLNYCAGDESYIPALGLRVTVGRNFSVDQPYDKYRVILNESAIRKLGWPIDESVLGRKIRFPGQEEGWSIVGVVSDFNYWSIDTGIQPMAIFHLDNEYLYNGPRRIIALRVDPTHAGLNTTLDEIRNVWKKHARDVPFDFGFVDQYFEETYSTLERFGNVLLIMASLAILIACFGLLGIIIYALEQRTKEIGIRKVSGASVLDILLLVNKSFASLIAIAFVIAAPIAWFATDVWLSEFAYRITPSAGIFIFTGFATLAIATIITTYHSMKAAALNPVDVLRDE